jgi:hypothetical protein
MAGAPRIKRGKLFCVLQNQLLQLKLQDFAGMVTSTIASQKRKRSPVRHTHVLEQSEDFVTVRGPLLRAEDADDESESDSDSEEYIA